MKQNGKLLGTLRLNEIDQPWFHCKFESTEAFQSVKPLFIKELELLKEQNYEEWENIYEKINSLNLSLFNIEDGNEINEFLLHIEADEAWFRY